jgi:peptidoglycan/LPS O-acetylase OafA/YrhL
MQTHPSLRGRRWIAALLAGASVLGTPALSHANDEVVTVLMLFGHATLLPAYSSVIYYAAASEKNMPLGWSFPNVITSLAAGSLGIMSIAGLANDQSDSADGYLAASSLVIGAGVVITATAFQASRSEEKQASALVVLPTIGAPGGSGSGAGVVVAGRF